MSTQPTSARGDIAIAILAAGSSSRMGRPKQILPFRGRSLIRHAADVALSAGCGPVIVVLGAYASKVRPKLSTLPVHIVINRAWSVGLGASIATAVRCAESLSPPIDALLLMLCDQVHLTPAVLKKLIRAWRGRTGANGVAACRYAGTIGTPAIFPRRLFKDLLKLPRAHGAKSILQSHAADLITIPFPGGDEDIDTPSDRARVKP